MPPGYSDPVLAVTPRGNSPLVELPLLRRPVGIADSRLQRLSSSALLTAIKSASFPMALLRGFLDRHPPRRKHRYYTKISGVCGRTQLSVQDANLAPCTFLLGKLKHKVSKKWAASCYQTFEVFFVLMAAARTNGRARPQIGFGFVSSSSMMSIWLSPFRRNGAGQYKLYCGPIFQ